VKRPAFAPTTFAVEVSGRGRPIIFIPGFACPGSVWEGTVTHLAGKVEAHVLTLAGAAGRPPIASPSLATLIEELGRYIVDNDLYRPVVVGHSLGGTLALWLAETFPDLGGIIDVDGAAFLPGLNDPGITYERAADLARTRSDRIAALTPGEVEPFIRQMMGHMFSRPEDLDRVCAEAARSDVATLAAHVAEGFAKDLRADLGRITTHVTLVAATPGGPSDQQQAAWRHQFAALEAAELVFVDAKHFVMFDRPDTFYALLDEALQRCWSPRPARGKR
jgi:pimeloyl-ACP methyl ester carboxylesterase